MKHLLTLLLFISTSTFAEIFDLECVPLKGGLSGESLKIIYTANEKEVFQNGNRLSYSYDPKTKAKTRLLNLHVDDYFIKFSYNFTADANIIIPGYEGEWNTTHYREINRATGIMTIRATIYENGIVSDFPGGGFSMKCSKRQNEF